MEHLIHNIDGTVKTKDPFAPGSKLKYRNLVVTVASLEELRQKYGVMYRYDLPDQVWCWWPANENLYRVFKKDVEPC